ncbi:MAG: thioredoxin domain-containing protein [Rhizomicrobium sp.]
MARQITVLARVLASVLAVYLCAGCAGVHPQSAAPAVQPAYAPFPGDHTLGNPNAPLVLIQYDAPGCPHCAKALAEVFPHIKADYIDTGKLFYVYRIFPLSKADVQVESVARCLPAKSYFSFMAGVLQQQPKWAPYYGAKDVREGLAPLARDAGLSDKEFDRCFSDTATLDRVQQEGGDAGAPFAIDGVPSFVINGEVTQGNLGWPALRNKIEAALARK